MSWVSWVRPDAEGRPPGAVTVGLKAATIAMDNYSFGSVEIMKDLLGTSGQARTTVAACQNRLDAYARDGRCAVGAPRLPKPPRARGCIVQVDFEALPDEAGRERFLNLSTTFALPRQDVDNLIAVGARLLQDSPGFQRPMRALSGTTRPEDRNPNCA